MLVQGVVSEQMIPLWMPNNDLQGIWAMYDTQTSV